MPRFDKWLIGVAPMTPVDRVARKALVTRLRAVEHYLEAAIGGDDEAEAIHQLRIWTRRTAAALRLFAPALLAKPARRLRKTLRRLRRAAGLVRDCDVHLEQLRSEAEKPPRRLIANLKHERRIGRRELKSLRNRLQKKERLARRSAAVLDAIAWPKRHSSRAAPEFAPWCREQLAAQGAAFFELAEVAADSDRQLHELRKAGKRLRYALELAAAAMAPRQHRKLYEELSLLQEKLGAVCDHLAKAEQLRDWQAQSKKHQDRQRLGELLAREEQRLALDRRKFHCWWSAARRSRLQTHWHAATS